MRAAAGGFSLWSDQVERLQPRKICAGYPFDARLQFERLSPTHWSFVVLLSQILLKSRAAYLIACQHTSRLPVFPPPFCRTRQILPSRSKTMPMLLHISGLSVFFAARAYLGLHKSKAQRPPSPLLAMEAICHWLSRFVSYHTTASRMRTEG
jgi:hypothetical protein